MKKCLLVHPRHLSEFSYWNYTEVCELIDAKYPESPLGLITVAALLPQEWEMKLLDLNIEEMDEELIKWANIVMTGGMIPQQNNILEIIDIAHLYGKPVVVGGPDPTSQPDLYEKADFLVLDEGEMTIPPFLQDLSSGVPKGVYRSDEKPDVTKSPTPRFDLLKFDSYLTIGIQYSRGCPFNCEFCDIIELFGRNPRVKTNEQILVELDTLYNLGYRGAVDFVDDNFIGNKKSVKLLIPELLKWCEHRGHPFYFATEATMNLADDEELLELMKAVDFRTIFVGIETPDEDLLARTQKKQNIRRSSIEENIRKIYSYGMLVVGGFIIGFDDEKPGIAESMIKCIEDTGISIAMTGLLVALPNTQLTRRLDKEGRLFSDRLIVGDMSKGVDHGSVGLNFITTRPRTQILEDHIKVLSQVYSVEKYFGRVIRTCLRLNAQYSFKDGALNWKKYLLGFTRVTKKLGFQRDTRGWYWKTLFTVIFKNIGAVKTAVDLMAMYIHFRRSTDFNIATLKNKIAYIKQIGEEKYNQDNLNAVSSSAY